MQSTGLPSTIGDIPIFSDTSGLYLLDSGVKPADKLSVNGSLPMTGTLDMGTHAIVNAGAITPGTTSATALGSAPKRFLATYTDQLIGPVVTSGLTSPSVDNTDDLGTTVKRYKNLHAAGVYAGSLVGPVVTSGLISPNVDVTDDIGTTTKRYKVAHVDEVVVHAMRPSLDAIIMGINATAHDAVNDGNVVIGNFANATTGYQNTCVGAGAQSTANDGVVYGNSSSVANDDTTVVGFSSVSTASKGHCFGGNLNNSTANSLLVEGGNNIRSETDAKCDLGTTAVRFKDLHTVNIYADNAQISKFKSSITGDVLTNTTTETSFLATAGITGSQVFATSRAGMQLKFKAMVYVSTLQALSDLTFSLKANSVVIWATTVSGPFTDVAHFFDVDLIILADTTVAGRGTLSIMGSSPLTVFPSNAWDFNISNTFDFTGAFSVADPGNQAQTGFAYLDVTGQ